MNSEVPIDLPNSTNDLHIHNIKIKGIILPIELYDIRISKPKIQKL